MKKIILAGGCFWGVQSFYDKIPGVIKTEVGYMHGDFNNPTYEQVCSASGHVEAVYIEFDTVSLEKLLEALFVIIDPYSINKQGGDVGVQYRTGIYYYNNQQKEIANNFIAKKQKDTDKEIMLEVKEVKDFFSAEEYHQKYLNKNPNGYCHINLYASLKEIGIDL